MSVKRKETVPLGSSGTVLELFERERDRLIGGELAASRPRLIEPPVIELLADDSKRLGMLLL